VTIYNIKPYNQTIIMSNYEIGKLIEKIMCKDKSLINTAIFHKK